MNYHAGMHRKYEPFQASGRTYFQVNVLYKNMSGVYCLNITFTGVVQFVVLEDFFRSCIISSMFRNERELDNRGK